MIIKNSLEKAVLAAFLYTLPKVGDWITTPRLDRSATDTPSRVEGIRNRCFSYQQKLQRLIGDETWWISKVVFLENAPMTALAFLTLIDQRPLPWKGEDKVVATITLMTLPVLFWGIRSLASRLYPPLYPYIGPSELYRV